MNPSKSTPNAAQLLPQWRDAWEPALAVWSPFTKLAPPTWLLDARQEKTAGLGDSFAMIRLTDHEILISLRQIAAKRLGRFSREVLAHEIGHHVLAPGDLVDNGRMLARLRSALPGLESMAPFVGNLYTDLLINDRLTRAEGLDLPGLYRALKPEEETGETWKLYMRIYELLWSLASGTLTRGEIPAAMQVDATLGARLIRAYRDDWLEGAGSFAALFEPYLRREQGRQEKVFDSLLDATRAGEGEEIPDGLAELDEGELTGALHPMDDPELSGVDESEPPRSGAAQDRGGKEAERRGGRKRRYRGPTEYKDLMASLGVKVDADRLVMRYYKELARRHLIPFPSRPMPRAADPLPEGLDPWDPGEPLSSVDWLESVIRAPHIIPGVTTVQRSYGTVDGSEPERQPLDLYLGIDCSGSMANPALRLSYPVLAGTVVALSALRAGARVMACLSGEPGRYQETEGWVRSEREILELLTGYLGTGYAFGIGRLQAAILDQPAAQRHRHLFIITDADLFYMLDQTQGGWRIAAESVKRAGGGATALLNIPYTPGQAEKKAIARLQDAGWSIHRVSSEEELVTFARAFARQTYHRGEVNTG